MAVVDARRAAAALPDGRAVVSAQPRTAASNPKYGCASCEDFGMIVAGGGRGTVLCTAEDCAAAERLQRQNQQPAAAESAAPGAAPEPPR